MGKMPLGPVCYTIDLMLFVTATVHSLVFCVSGYFSNWVIHAMVVVLALNVTLKELARG